MSGLKGMLGMRPDMSIGYYLRDFLFRRLLRQNTSAQWAVHHTSTIHNGHKIKKGKGVWPGDSPGMYINGMNGIVVGDYSNLGPNVGIISANHDLIDNTKHIPGAPIEIGRFCWIGMGVIILPQVKLGDFTIAAAGAVITKSFPDGYCVLGGNPAKVIKELNKEECDAFAKTKV
ncbi:MAG: hypothetical protein JWQ38_2671 [Flavipsychrobacter sp.]|nr:hypothetical protein [Flavipsychrobacter sp.]